MLVCTRPLPHLVYCFFFFLPVSSLLIQISSYSRTLLLLVFVGVVFQAFLLRLDSERDGISREMVSLEEHSGTCWLRSSQRCSFCLVASPNAHLYKMGTWWENRLSKAPCHLSACAPSHGHPIGLNHPDSGGIVLLAWKIDNLATFYWALSQSLSL